jgi:alpha-L-fucosidase
VAPAGPLTAPDVDFPEQGARLGGKYRTMHLARALCLTAALAPACRATAPALEAPGTSPAGAAPEASADLAWWHASMAGREARLAWWREARFGMFVHWGVYSALGGVWEGQPVKGYAEHIQRIRKIPIAVYRQRVAGAFRPTGFDADAWIAAAKAAGMGYFIITAKHHDGFAMYDSAVGDYDVVDATPWKTDPMRALKDACRRHGLKFGFYYSHAFDWGDAEGAGNDWEYDNPGGDRLLHGGAEWWKHEPALLGRVRRYVDRKAIPQLRELIANYDPDILWFDTPHKLPPEENLRILQAVRAAKPDVVINGRIVQPVPDGPEARFGDYRSTADRPAEFPPVAGDWEAIPTTNESYGWHRLDASHKPPAHFIALLAKAAARGGNVLLNVGPMGDGRIDPRDGEILAGVGRWMQDNGPSIVGSERTPLPVQAWGESTRKGRTLYLHVLAWPAATKGAARLVVGGLRTPVKTATLLARAAGDARLEVERLSEVDLAITVPARAPDAADTVIALELAGEPQTEARRLLQPAELGTDTLRAFDAQLEGGLRFGAGKTRDAWVHDFTRADQAVRWPVRLREPARVAVAISYDAPATAGGTFVVDLGGQSLAGRVRATPGQPVAVMGTLKGSPTPPAMVRAGQSPAAPHAVPLGEVSLPAGAFDIVVKPSAITGTELVRLRAVTLTAVKTRP